MNKAFIFKKYSLTILILLIFTLFFGFLSYNNKYITILKSYESNITAYINKQIQTFQNDNPNTKIQFKKIYISVDGISLKDVQITTKFIQKTNIPSLNLNLDWLNLLSFSIKFKITAPIIYTKIKTKDPLKSIKTTSRKDENYQQLLIKIQKNIKKIKKSSALLSLFNLPISNLNILKGNIELINKKTNKYIAKINNSIINFNITRNRLKLNFFSSFISFSNSFLKKKTFALQIKTSLFKNKKFLLWTKLNYKHLSNLIKIDEKHIELQLNTPIKNIAELINKEDVKNSIKDLTGDLFLLIKNKKLNNKFSFTSKLTNFKSLEFKVGNLNVDGFLLDNQLHFNQVQLQSPVWTVKTNPFFIDIKKSSYPISFDANISKFRLNHLLKDNYIKLFAKSLTNCNGQLYPFFLNCSLTKTYIDNLKVYLKNNKEIVSVPSLQGLAKVKINTKSVNFNSSIFTSNNVNKNKITANGTINYASDSKISYQLASKDLSFLKLFSKPLSGNAQINGLVKIQSKNSVNTNKFTSSNFSIGKKTVKTISFDTIYTNQQLFIKNLFVKKNNGQIKGSLDFLFKKNTLFTDIQGRNINLSNIKPFLNINNKHFFSGTIKKILSKTLWDLDFRPLSSNTQVEVDNLLIKKLYFPRVNINLKKNITNNFVFLKLNSLKRTLLLDGYIFNNFRVNLNLNAKKLALENFIYSYNSFSLTSLMDINAKIKGDFFNPNLKIKVNLYKTYLNKVLQKNSNSFIKYSNNKLSGLANFFNKAIVTVFKWDIKKRYFDKLSINVTNWDYSSLISLYSRSKKNIKANLTAKLNFFKNKQDRYSGFLNIPNISITQGKFHFKNKKNISLTLKDDILFIKKFALKGKYGYLNIQSKEASSLEKLNILVNSKVKLPILNNFLPEDIIASGDLLFNNFTISGDFLKPIFNGKIQLHKFSTKNTNNKLSSIKDSKINISIHNSNAKLNTFIIYLKNNGVLNASGYAFFQNSFPVNINGKLTNLPLQTKTGLDALGSGTFKLSGKKGSYVLQSIFEITSGSFYKKLLKWNKKNLDIDEELLPKKAKKSQISLFSPTLHLKLKTKNPLKTKLIVGNITIDTKAFGNLELNGPINRPLLTGKIYSNAGEITVQKQTILIDNIKIEYDNTLFNKSNVSLLAHSEVKKIKVKIKARGFLDDIKVILSSDPPLSEQKIAFLLVFGSFPDDSNTNWKEASKSTSYAILSTLLKDYLKINENLNVNLHLTTKTNDNTNNFSAGNIKLQSQKPILNLEKKLTKNLKIQATQEFDDKSQNTFLLQYQINPNLSIKSSISGENKNNSSDKKKNIEFGLEYDIEFE
ncbi:MAG: hypothetical protein HAW63_03690 [Bdellovibrionaceae bacterium]|nr:hypothetical protein [Pseudobdellovibrionaceae bacterium]